MKQSAATGRAGRVITSLVVIVVASGLCLSEGSALATPQSIQHSSGTARLRQVVIFGIGDLAKELRAIEARRKKPPTSDLDVYELQILFLGPLAIKNDTVPKIKRARGHTGLTRASIGYFTQMACWGTHSSDMIGWASKGNRPNAQRESSLAADCLRRARRVQADVSRLLRLTAGEG